jgi:hypothetical protein
MALRWRAGLRTIVPERERPDTTWMRPGDRPFPVPRMILCFCAQCRSPELPSRLWPLCGLPLLAEADIPSGADR